MAQITVYRKIAGGNWDDADGWNDQAGGGGTNYTDPQNGGGNTYICDMNSKTCVLNVNATVDLVQSSNSAGYLTISGTRILTADVTYSSTGTSGMVRYTTGQDLTINGQVNNTASGYGVVGTGSGVLTVSNPGDTAATYTGGRAISHGSTGNLTITGAVRGVYVTAAATVSITGDVSATNNGIIGLSASAGTITITGNVSTSGAGNSTTAGVSISGGTVTIDGNVSAACTTLANFPAGNGVYISGTGAATINGNLSSTGAGAAVYNIGSSTTVTWTGSRTLAADTDCSIVQLGSSATIILATASAALSLACAGRLSIKALGGSVTITAAAGTAAITLTDTAAQAAIIGTEADIISAFGGDIVVLGNPYPILYPGLIPTPY